MSIMNQQQWNNWSGFQHSQPEHILKPSSIDELKNIVQNHHKIRVVGAGHSFTPLVCTDATLLSLDHFSGVENVNTALTQANIWSGTRLFNLDQYLEPIQQSLMQQGDIDQQSLAGAVSTGTHGTGLNLHCISAYVEAFELLTASGDILTCSRQDNPNIFEAGRVSLGSLGILTKITMQNKPRYKLKEHVRLCSVNEFFENIDLWKTQHRHIECFAFSHADQLILKTLDITDEDIQPRKLSWPSEDALLTICCSLTKSFPALNPKLQKLLGVFIKPTTFVDWSSQIFPTPRETKFNEMEYQIPIESGMECLEAVLTALKNAKAQTFFPVEFRFVKGDDIWLSPFYRQDSISISVHQYHKQAPNQLFDEIEPIFQHYRGRPHWGKMHNMGASQLQALYPKWDDFMQLRAQLDPTQKFLNPYLEKLFFTA
ncbi:FAD-binding protein [Acinetobacter bereziniae]|nr:D-arabinono-1,4-lactone oxidase [Acinetobacter bereziniae]MBJ8422074.1 FAD-binding protein [Acinetobacter bereziniae]MBJ9904099.1 FAD-binding protein [Acinetobacter bereziniae]MCU4320100.1 FAD-binding protein [Acinetobacter bereziniae]MCU4475861.1 FAD-binding protein [Acinetobacter bereziniae]MCU4539770.1 FAD-binding protein [Acinetobacter bereziniae]